MSNVTLRGVGATVEPDEIPLLGLPSGVASLDADGNLVNRLIFVALTPAAAVAVPADNRAASLAPDQVTALTLETTGILDGTIKTVMIDQGATGYAITFGAGITETSAGQAVLISDVALDTSFVRFMYHAAKATWFCIGVAVEI